FNDTATTEIYTLSLHDALPICFIEAATLEIAARVITRALFGYGRIRPISNHSILRSPAPGAAGVSFGLGMCSSLYTRHLAFLNSLVTGVADGKQIFKDQPQVRKL